MLPQQPGECVAIQALEVGAEPLVLGVAAQQVLVKVLTGGVGTARQQRHAKATQRLQNTSSSPIGQVQAPASSVPSWAKRTV